MRRREFIAGLAGALAWPVPIGAQQGGTNRKVGILHPGKGAALDARVTAINDGLNDPSQRFSTELVVSLAYGELSRLPSLAADLDNDRVHAIVAVGPPAVQAAKSATADIPLIAIDLESDPVARMYTEASTNKMLIISQTDSPVNSATLHANRCRQRWPVRRATPDTSGGYGHIRPRPL